MRVTYFLALAVLAVAVVSAGRIPTANDDEIQNVRRDGLNRIRKEFHHQWNQRNQHFSHKIPHHGFRGHAKPAHVHTTETPSTESESEAASNATVGPLVTETASQLVSTDESVTENVSANAESVVSTAASTSEALVDATATNNVVETTANNVSATATVSESGAASTPAAVSV